MIGNRAVIGGRVLVTTFSLLFGVAAWTQVTAGRSDQGSTPGPADQSAQKNDNNDEHTALPAGAGRDLMIRVCSTCHSPDTAADEQLDAKGWKELVDDMASKGADATEAEFEAIVQYLTHAFPPSK